MTDIVEKELSPEVYALIDRLVREGEETLEKGRKRLDGGIYDEALSHFEEALEYFNGILKIQPDNAEAWVNKCSTLNELGLYEKNIDACDDALKIIGDNAKIYQQYAYALNSLPADTQTSIENYQFALIACERALQIDQNFVDALTSKSYALTSLQRYKEAVDACDQALSISPIDETALINKGHALRRLGKYEESLTEIEKALKYHPESINALEHKCELLLFDRKNPQEALKTCNKALEKNVDKIELWELKAKILYELGEFEGASDAAYQSLTLTPNPTYNSVILYGKTMLGIGTVPSIQEALSVFEWAININQDNGVEAWIGKGICSLRLGRYEDALAAAQQIFNKSTNPGIRLEAHLIGSEALYYLDRYGEALLESGKANEIEPSNFKARLFHGKALVGLGDFNGAVQIFSELITIDTGSIDAWLGKAHALYGLNQLDEAIVAYNEVLNLDKKNTEALNYKGLAIVDKISEKKKKISKEDCNEAFECWDQSIKIDPKNSFALISKGKKLDELGEYQEASQYYKEADKLNPEDPRITRWIGRIEGIIETEESYKENLINYRTELLKGSNTLLVDTTNYLSGLLWDFRIGINTVMAMFIVQFVAGLLLLLLSLYFSAIGRIPLGSTILGMAGGLGLIISMIVLSPMRLQKNRVDFSQWMMAYSNWSNTFFAVNDLYARKALGEDKGVNWDEIKGLHTDLYNLTKDTITMVEDYCEFAEGKSQEEKKNEREIKTENPLNEKPQS